MSTAPDLRLVNPAFFMRRFDTADLSEHGKWIMPRMLKAYPHLNERGVATFVQNIIFNNEYLFLYQQTGVALAQVMSAHTLSPKPLIYERFVWVENIEDKAQLKNAAEFYSEFRKWAKQQDAETIVVEQNSDVPHDLIKEKLGRVFTRQEQFARV